MRTDDDLNFGRLLGRFDLNPAQLTRANPNIFKISGFPRRETVASNIWAYFLDPSESHNMGTLFLDSLHTCLQEKFRASGKDGRLFEDAEAAESSVIQEYSSGTPTRNRLDIVVRSENAVIGIENKVDAALYNPLDDYWDKIRNTPSSRDQLRMVDECGARTELIVVLHQRGLAPESTELIRSRSDFLEVSYDELFSEVLRNIGSYLMDANPRAVDLFQQFVENFSEERSMRNVEELDAAIEQFLRQVGGSEREFLPYADLFELMLTAAIRSLLTWTRSCRSCSRLTQSMATPTSSSMLNR